jgi:hypothetical protein
MPSASPTMTVGRVTPITSSLALAFGEVGFSLLA